MIPERAHHASRQVWVFHRTIRGARGRRPCTGISRASLSARNAADSPRRDTVACPLSRRGSQPRARAAAASWRGPSSRCPTKPDQEMYGGRAVRVEAGDSYSSRIWKVFQNLIACNRFVEIEEHAADRSPCREFFLV